MRQATLNYIFLSLCVFLIAGMVPATAQNLIYNGTFDAMGAGWTTSCTSVEAWGYETTYGGPSPTNHVAEIDDEACMHQDVCVLPGSSYTFSMDASCRTAGGPNPCISHINIIGLDASNTLVATYVDMDYTRTNTVFSLTPVTGIPVITVPSGSGVVRLRITLTDNTPGYSTLGMIIDNLTLTFVTPPNVIAQDTVCLNVPLYFSVGGIGTGISYNWDFGPGATPPTSTSSDPSASWNTSGIKTVSVALGNGVCYVDTLAHNVYVSPAIHASRTDTTCFNIPYMFNGVALHISGAYTDTIVITGGCDSIITLQLFVKPPVVTHLYDSICTGTTFNFNGHIYSTTGIYTDTLLNDAGCDSVPVLHLQVNPKPAPPSVSSPSYCQGDIAGALSATGTSLMWYGPGITGGSPAAPTVSTAVPGVFNYHVTQTVLGCTSDQADATVTIKPKPAAPKADDASYCQGQIPAQLTAAGTGLQWYSSPAGDTPLSAAPIPSTVVTGVNHWYVSQVVNGCVSDRTQVTVTVAPLPDFTIAATHDHICQGDTVTFYYNGAGPVYTYNWSLPAGTIVALYDVASPAITLRFDEPGTKNLYLTVLSPGGICSKTDTLNLKVVPTPTALSDTKHDVCLGDTVSLAITSRSANTDSFFWYVDNTPMHQSDVMTIISQNQNSGGPFSIVWTNGGKHTIELYTQTKEGCRSANTFDSVKVNVPPNAQFGVYPLKGTLCLMDSVEFKAEETNYNYSYLWSPAHYFNNLNTSDVWGRMEEQHSDVTLMVTDPYGCFATSTQELNPGQCCTVALPTAFTPNGDSYNNIFRPLFQGYHKFHVFRIMNRWGQTVFESGNNQVSWDGNYNGVPQDMGVYYYYLKFDCGGNVITQTGDVTLIR